MNKAFLMLVAVFLSGAPQAHALLIDDYASGTTDIFANVVAPDVRFVGSGPGILGGQRESTVSYSAPDSSIGGNIGVRVNFFSDGTLHHNQDAGVAGSSTFIYDGSADVNTPGGTFETDATGLGGLDLAAGGTSDRFLLNVLFADHAVNDVLNFRVYTDANNYSTLSRTITSPINTPTLFEFLYSDFVQGIGASGAADFGNIGAIVFMIDGQEQQALDLQLDDLETNTIPEPATIILFGFGLGGLLMLRKRAILARIPARN